MPRPINILAKYKLLSIGEEGFAVYAEECKLIDAKKKFLAFVVFIAPIYLCNLVYLHIL